MKVRDLRDSAEFTLGRWLINKDWSSVLVAESYKENFDKFITEIQAAVDTYLSWKTLDVHPKDRPWTTKKIKMLIKKRQAAFIRDGKDSPSYKLLRNKVQHEIKSANYQYYHP